MGKQSDECYTPRDFFGLCSQFWGPFTIDVAADCQNRLCERWCGTCVCSAGLCDADRPGGDGLAYDWRNETVWCNPPYSDIAPWVEKAVIARRAVLLLPSNTDTEWFSTIAERAAEVRFLRGRMKFEGPGTMYVDKKTGLLTSSTARGRHLVAVFDKVKRRLLRDAHPEVCLSWDWRKDL